MSIEIKCALCGKKFDAEPNFIAHLESCRIFKDAGGIVYADGAIKYEIEPLLFGEARIIETDELSIFRQWLYETPNYEEFFGMLTAKKRFREWEENGFNGSPSGWWKAIIDPRKIQISNLDIDLCELQTTKS